MEAADAEFRAQDEDGSGQCRAGGRGVSDRAPPELRNAYPHFTEITTRWMDNDVYGHVNNVVYYSYFDTAVNEHLIRCGYLDTTETPIVGLVAETGCRYFSSISFPDRVAAGIRVARLGTSSVRYEIGLFRNDEDAASAQGHFVHVYVDRATNRPAPIPDKLRAIFEGLKPAA
jgi:acyl-CoA thioester hydrolase